LEEQLTKDLVIECPWCKDGPPVWSYDAKVWIHRRDSLDRRCWTPYNDYGYTTQVPELTISDERKLGKYGRTIDSPRRY
jgi:hypothetical protein